MKAWLKGGLIGGIIAIILEIIYASTTTICVDPLPGCVKAITQINFSSLDIYLVTLFFALIGFIIGAVIGLIVRKVKARNNHGLNN